MAGTASTAEGTDLLARLADAHEDYERCRERVAEIGEDDLRALADAHDEATTLLDRYEGRATGSGDFEAFVTFQSAFAEHTEDLPDDLPAREAFERAAERIDKRRLTERDFERAREALSTAEESIARLDDRATARERYREARRAVLERRRDADERIEELSAVRRYGEADLDAPVEELRKPIAAYDETVREAFGRFRREESARDVLAFVATTAPYPLVPFVLPPTDLESYVERHEAGTEPIPTLLEYAGYSGSKLDHYVADSQELKRHVATHCTYLERLDAAPLEVGWPPPPADRLWWRARELVSVASRFVDEDCIAALRRVRGLARDRERYERLREAARAREVLDAETRERLQRGEIRQEVATLRDERERLDEALSTYPAV